MIDKFDIDKIINAIRIFGNLQTNARINNLDGIIESLILKIKIKSKIIIDIIEKSKIFKH